MRLIKIKLAGFKSFVDPTTVHLPGNLVAIVGPNGCGKSNVIDAVRWVMGESSARQLRGESMADVIFNGSSARKPVGQATIELVFDNSDGGLGGQWAGFREIAIKRQLNRDGQSQYYLNGSRCRRRDITDIFLGTGLGPRSYAIIEQGTISRLIEARPEEMRVFLEEAAGISRYKERRRETENRIEHTRANLSRLTDVRGELDKQLDRLRRQAQAAQQYQTLRAEEHRLKATVFALRWQVEEREVTVLERRIAAAETTSEAGLAEQREVEVRCLLAREHLAGLHDGVDAAQARLYEQQATIARLEQRRSHLAELRHRREGELARLRSSAAEWERRESDDRAALDEARAGLALVEPALTALEVREDEVQGLHESLERQGRELESMREAEAGQLAEIQRDADRERATIARWEQQQFGARRRLEHLNRELEELASHAESGALAERHRAVAAREVVLDGIIAGQAEVDQALERARIDERANQDALASCRLELETVRGRLASLTTLQTDALRTDSPPREWLQSLGLGECPQLARMLEVEPGWERAVEVVLRDRLAAYLVPDGFSWDAIGANPPAVRRALVRDRNQPDPPPADSLAARVRGPVAVLGWLACVLCAGDRAAALARLPGLQADESVITPDGLWLGGDWMESGKPADTASGVLARQREIAALDEQLKAREQRLATLTEEAQALTSRINALERERAAALACHAEANRDLAREQAACDALALRLEHERHRRTLLDGERRENDGILKQATDELARSRIRLEQAVGALRRHEVSHAARLAEREQTRNEQHESRVMLDAVRRERQQKALQGAEMRHRVHALEAALARLADQRADQIKRQSELERELAESDGPEAVLETDLHHQLEIRGAREDELATARAALEAQQGALRSLEQQLQALQSRQAEAARALEHLRLAAGEARARRHAQQERLEELGMTPAAALAGLPDDADERVQADRLETIARRIQRLGPINLAAIDEHREFTERKVYLDAQDADLNEALATLENAIRKIDRETRSRFQGTFDAVSAGLGHLFPRLFGGGQAHLALTGDDALEAGVLVMARPPGKRIGNIHLLSGGEKALTAVALVFAIFQLNPAPFCMLDEVDAPLDEANVGRFGALLQEMSEQVQFIVITHNKGTMDITRHLAGVTMNEPGVSRLVTVDVEEAVRLAAV